MTSPPKPETLKLEEFVKNYRFWFKDATKSSNIVDWKYAGGALDFAQALAAFLEPKIRRKTLEEVMFEWGKPQRIIDFNNWLKQQLSKSWEEDE